MKLSKGLLIFSGAIAILIGLSIPAGSFARDGNKKSQATDKNFVVIGHLQTRDRVVTIGRGPEGPVYTIKNKKGKVLAENIGEKNLKAKFPSIYSQVKDGFASNDARLQRDEIDRIHSMKIRD
jgi:hypothetical protein